jgi:hypothetical protein
VPVAAEELTVMVMVAEKVGSSKGGLKLIVTPEGWPEAERLTVCVVPLKSVAVAVVVVLPPCWTEPLDGLTETTKSKD